ncbi:hypothetical protein CHARACLAT_033386 [Characodon lateralis]|uniref:Hsp90 co-chaperone Cdc37-like 1 n=1 Tax=Characodon lateralis TaxID=208331 RepID=A0ABU7EYZ7_9TELE|nr:hypothetical protein [Characodon lateralis]
MLTFCFVLQKEALLDQVAHQAVVMQFILEMASNSQQDPRGCFRQFFHKAKEGQDVYLEVFSAELEVFKQRVKEYAAKCRNDALNVEQQNDGRSYRPNTKGTTDFTSQVSAAVFSLVSLNLVISCSYPVELINVTKKQLLMGWWPRILKTSPLEAAPHLLPGESSPPFSN